MHISTIAIPTRDPARAVATAAAFLDVAQRGGRTIDVCIAAREHDVPRDAFAALRRRAHVTVIDRSFTRRLVETLVAAGCDPEVVAFALQDPLGLGSSTGNHRNALQLVARDRWMLMVDDDIAPRVHGTIRPGLDVIAGDPTSCRFFASAESAASTARTEDPFALLEQGLELAPPPGRPRIVASWLGTLGDPGTPNGLYLLTQPEAVHAALAPDDASYLAYRDARIVLHAVERTTVCSGAGWSPGIVAYDGRALLPPFTTTLRGEGLVWGAAIDAGRAWSLVRMPGALAHRIAEPNHHAAEAMLAKAGGLATNTIVAALLSHTQATEPIASPARALVLLGQQLGELARSPSAFAEIVATIVAQRTAALEDLLADAAARRRGASPAWDRDVERTRRELARTRAAGGRYVPYDLVEHAAPHELLRTIVRRIAALYEHWPTLVEAASVLQKNGTSPTSAGVSSSPTFSRSP